MTPFLTQHDPDFVLLLGILEMNTHTIFHEDSIKTMVSGVEKRFFYYLML